MIGNCDELKRLFHEGNQLAAIFTRIGKTAKQPLSPKSEIQNPKSEILS